MKEKKITLTEYFNLKNSKIFISYLYIWNSNTLYGNTEFVSNYKFSGLKINALLNALTWIKNIKLGEIGVTKDYSSAWA